MNVRTGSIASLPDVGNNLPLFHLLTRRNMQRGAMAIKRCECVVMLYLHIVPVRIMPGRGYNHTISRGKDRRSCRSRYIRTAVKLSFSGFRVGSVAVG